MTGDSFVKCMSNFSHWVVKVLFLIDHRRSHMRCWWKWLDLFQILLFARGDHQVRAYADKNLLFSMTKDYITLHTWEDCHGDSGAHPHCHLFDMADPVYSIPLCTGKSFGFRDIFFTPGLHLYGDNLGFIKQMPMFETHTIGIQYISIQSTIIWALFVSTKVLCRLSRQISTNLSREQGFGTFWGNYFENSNRYTKPQFVTGPRAE